MKKLLLILGVVILGLTSCKKEKIEIIDDCNCGVIENITDMSLTGINYYYWAEYVINCGSDTVSVVTFDENLEDDIIPTDNDILYWYVIDNDSPYEYGDSLLTIKENGVYKNCQ